MWKFIFVLYNLICYVLCIVSTFNYENSTNFRCSTRIILRENHRRSLWHRKCKTFDKLLSHEKKNKKILSKFTYLHNKKLKNWILLSNFRYQNLAILCDTLLQSCSFLLCGEIMYIFRHYSNWINDS